MKHIMKKECHCGKWHIGGRSFNSENDMLKFQIKKLEVNVKQWNNAWHEMRLRVGEAFWQQPYKMINSTKDS